jgi:hypothetical protein
MTPVSLPVSAFDDLLTDSEPSPISNPKECRATCREFEREFVAQEVPL